MPCPVCGSDRPSSDGRCPACGAPARSGLPDTPGPATGSVTAPIDAIDDRAGGIANGAAGDGADGSRPELPAGDGRAAAAFTTGTGAVTDAFAAALAGGTAVVADATALGASRALRPPLEAAGTQPAGAPLAPGQPFGARYRIVRLLGVGGMGAVYEAWDAELAITVALKVVRPDVASDPAASRQMEQRFKRELLLARQVTHQNVVRIHDLGEIDGIKYITMSFIDGEDLATILRREGPLPPARALRVMRSVLSGLVAAHQAGVVHRDLKPANIMVRADDEALIMDFGIARLVGRPDGDGQQDGTADGSAARPSLLTSGDTQLGKVVGTLEYMAPEQARGQVVDERADIYSFGLICHAMLVGRADAATAGDALADLMNRMTQAPPSPRSLNPAVPEALDRIVTRCVQPAADDRYPTSAELAEAVARLDAEGKPLPIRRHVTWRLVAGVAAVVLALVAGTWYLSRTPPVPEARDPVSVLVADFENRTGDRVFDGLMEQPVTVGVESASFISAYQRPAALRVARLLKAGTRLDEQTARLVALREGIKIVLLGVVEPRGTGYALSMRGVDPASGQVVLTVAADSRDRASILGAGGVLASRVRSALGDTRTETADQKETFTTASLEAVSAYTQAQELSSAGKDQEAIPYFEKAAALDPNFGRAYGGLAMSLTRLGRREEAARSWQEALKHLDRMTDREQYRLLGAYYTYVTRNYETARDTYEKLVREYPADGAGHNNLAVAYFRGLQFAKAVEEGRTVRRLYPNSPLYRTNLALYAMYAGEFALAAEEAQALVDEELASYDAFLPLAISAVADGKVDLARAAYERMSAADPAGASLAALGLADLEIAEGRAADAAATLRAGIARDEAEGYPAGAAAKYVALADALGMRGDAKGAAAASEKALAIDKTEAQIVPAVRWLLATGRADEAADLGRTLDERLEAQARAHGRLVAGQVALARGRRVEAVDALREALKLADLWLGHYYLGRAYLEASAPAEAFAEFELCLKRKGEGYAVFLDDLPTVRYVSPVRYWMGRARQDLGLLPQAQADYQAFIDAQAAQSSDPLFADARTRVGRQ